MNGITRREMLRRSAVAGVAGCTLTGTALTLEACNASSWIQIALNDLPTVLQIAIAIINIVGAAKGQVDPGVIATAQKLAAEVQTDLQTAQTLIQQYQSSPSSTLLQKINAALVAVNSNLSAILTALHINNSTLQATIAAAIGSAISIVTYLESLVPTPTVTAAAKMKAAQTSNAPYVKAAFNMAVTAAGGSQYVIQ